MLTVIIPTKDEETALPKLLASLGRQTAQPAEIIVADAQSADRTRDIARAFGARIVEGGLPGPGRNRGAEAAATDWLLFLDADVELADAAFLAHSMEEIARRRLDIATCEVEPMGAGRIDRAMHGVYNRYTKAMQNVFPHAPGFCIFVRRSLHEEIRGFDESVVFCEDHDYARRAAKVGRFGILHTRIPVSTRRWVRDGRLQTACKYVLAELHLATVGPIRSNVFRYTFGHGKKVTK